MNRPYSEATVEVVAAAVADARDDDVFSDSEWNGSHWEGNRDQYRGDARAALDALAAAGLLLPEGAETRTEYGVEHTYPGQEPIGLPAVNRWAAERAAGQTGGIAVRRLVERTTWSTPWRPAGPEVTEEALSSVVSTGDAVGQRDAVRLAVGDSKESQDHDEVSGV